MTPAAPPFPVFVICCIAGYQIISWITEAWDRYKRPYRFSVSTESQEALDQILETAGKRGGK